MMKIVQSLQELERHWAVMKTYEGYPSGTTTINPAVIEGGRHAAFIADECRLWITVHFYPNETHEQIIKEIEEYIGKVAAADPWLSENPPQFKWGGESMIVDRGEIFPSLEIDSEHAAVKTLSSAHESVLSKHAILDMSATVTDGGWFSEFHIPAVIYGPGTLEEAHSINEKVEVEQLIEFTKVITAFIYEWCHTKK